MKKLVYIAFVAAALCLGFSACEDEIDTTESIVSETPAADAAGIYSGNWVNAGSKDTTETVGSVTIATVDGEPYICSLSIVNEDYTDSGNANIIRTCNDFKIYNMQEGKTLGTKTLFGQIVDGELSLTFTAISGKGRNATQVVYSFTGTK